MPEFDMKTEMAVVAESEYEMAELCVANVSSLYKSKFRLYIKVHHHHHLRLRILMIVITITFAFIITTAITIIMAYATLL